MVQVLWGDTRNLVYFREPNKRKSQVVKMLYFLLYCYE